ncbi:MAG: phosphoribosylglycinamide formyltransferase [Candidatus Fluviicola riflensis]|nr:MAG: phosphoribosylglycinamide formyltransferase [Candidatus Fluviicola riflensis]OGS78337.1 MAG: phosphoribosylglycinamide formyltransferase [Candidatus Fluviicola riflensis]OGS85403.1 MAG: phosphoribosylglycinamide formyltransferase [Fluviicola sp. RIFCSPHIGHO2_01_FULL_43_53]OGS87445.1 MAG: phosphoribosylglycinamide formyltransferase [Fluviicola sp. RIFCSPHIGHO2_12_FULL_43_24]
MNIQSIAVFASGTGSNAIRLIEHFAASPTISVALVVCNKPAAPVVEKVRVLGIEVLVMDNASFESGLTLLQELHYRHIDWIVLAGFLRKIPVNIIRGFQDRIINIHPALLPKFGGKGMYGIHVHKAVVEACEPETGISIHLVNEEFDKGRLLAQFKVAISENDTPESVAAKVQELEHLHFANVVETIILEQV